MLKRILTIPAVLLLLTVFSCENHELKAPTKNQSERFVLNESDLSNGTHHTNHAGVFGKYVEGYNKDILKGIDKVQKTAMDGGGYFIGVTAEPPESPVGYSLTLNNKELYKPARRTSFCSGASYAAFIEGLNLVLNENEEIPYPNYESLCMTEEDGSRREDGVKFWGKWNADGYGNHFALVQYSGMGKVVKPEKALPGDFMNISWKNGGGHSVVFLGWYLDENNKKHVVYWSSQKGTNGFGDDVVPIDRIAEVMVVRLTDPDAVYDFDVDKSVKTDVKGYQIDW